MNNLFLMTPALLSCVGEGVDIHLECLLKGDKSPLREDDGFFGKVKQVLRPFPNNLEACFRSRNNQVLWHCLAQIEDHIQVAIEKFGRSRIAVVMGTSTAGVDENLPLFQSGTEHQNWSAIPFNQDQQLFSAPADFVAEVYGLTGLVYGISTACTSGARALISAARLLNANLCDAVICGGVDTLSPLTIKGFDSLSVLSHQQTNPLSVNRQGINIGEGAGVFLMSREPLCDYSLQLLGYGSSSDAYHMSSPHPEGEGAMSAFQNALNSALLQPSQIGWINLHGTGTLHNDQMESIAIAKIFGEQTACTSTKSYTGHTLGAAGAIEAAILWAVVSRKHNPMGKLPPQLWDKQVDLTLPSLSITDERSVWKEDIRIGVSSSFAFGGNNSVLIIGEPNG